MNIRALYSNATFVRFMTRRVVISNVTMRLVRVAIVA